MSQQTFLNLICTSFQRGLVPTTGVLIALTTLIAPATAADGTYTSLPTIADANHQFAEFINRRSPHEPSQWTTVQPGNASETRQDEEPPQETAEEKFKRFRGRLPNYFSRVIDEEQRQKVYEIQANFNEQIDALQQQIANLTQERDKLAEEVLTPEQLAEVNKMREEARAKRAANRNSDDDSGNR